MHGRKEIDMKKYRIRAINVKTGEKMLLPDVFRSRKKAEEMLAKWWLSTPHDVAKFEIVEK